MSRRLYQKALFETKYHNEDIGWKIFDLFNFIDKESQIYNNFHSLEYLPSKLKKSKF